MARSDSASQRSGGGISAKAKIAAVLGIAASVAAVFLLLSDQLSLAQIVQREQQLRAWQESHPTVVFAAAFALYAVATGLSVPGATVLSLIYGWYFGLVPAVILVSFASTSGGTLAFLTSRYLLRDVIQNRFGNRLRSINDAMQRDGALYLFTARLIPGVPFVIINLVMGLTRLRVWTFWWVSQLGMLPGTILYVWTGDSFPDLKTLANRGLESIITPEMLAAFVCLGLFPLVAKRILSLVHQRRSKVAASQRRR